MDNSKSIFYRNKASMTKEKQINMDLCSKASVGPKN